MKEKREKWLWNFLVMHSYIHMWYGGYWCMISLRVITTLIKFSLVDSQTPLWIVTFTVLLHHLALSISHLFFPPWCAFKAHSMLSISLFIFISHTSQVLELTPFLYSQNLDLSVCEWQEILVTFWEFWSGYCLFS